MIKARILEDGKKGYTGFRIKGHAGYADSGSDIVCAAVSILVINTVNSIESFTKATCDVRSKKKTGLIECRIISGNDEDCQLLIRNLILGLTIIQKEYGKEYIEIVVKKQ